MTMKEGVEGVVQPTCWFSGVYNCLYKSRRTNPTKWRNNNPFLSVSSTRVFLYEFLGLRISLPKTTQGAHHPGGSHPLVQFRSGSPEVAFSFVRHNRYEAIEAAGRAVPER